MSLELILGVIIGIVFGFFLSSLLKKGNDDSLKLKELEAEHEAYRKQVDDHFVNTAVLFKGLTDQYRDVYRHIASGAGELCSEEAKALQVDLEETALLAISNEEIEVAEELASVNSAEPSPNGRPNEDGVRSVDVDDPEVGSINEDEVPLASEVEMSAEIAEEIKSQVSKKAT